MTTDRFKYLDDPSWWAEQLAKGIEQYEQKQRNKQRRQEEIESEVSYELQRIRKQYATKRAKREKLQLFESTIVYTDEDEENMLYSAKMYSQHKVPRIPQHFTFSNEPLYYSISKYYSGSHTDDDY